MNKLILLLIYSVISVGVLAHENRPLYVDVTEVNEFEYSVKMKVPPTVAINNQPQLTMPDDCLATGLHKYRCQSDMAGKKITVMFSQYNPSVSTFMRLTRGNGEIYSELLTAEQSTWQVPAAETATGVAKHYTWLGIEHILIGIDHLLFLACLLFIAKTFKRVVLTVTGFTIAHSMTLMAAALEWVTVPVAPVETLIAFSIVFLATEIARNNSETLTQRFPILVSSSFGLLHGFGFAAVLRDIGLPQTEVLTGLLFFNVGVEIGQLCFTLICFIVAFILLKVFRLQTRSLVVGQTICIYVVGIVASYWMFERGLSVLAG